MTTVALVGLTSRALGEGPYTPPPDDELAPPGEWWTGGACFDPNEAILRVDDELVTQRVDQDGNVMTEYVLAFEIDADHTATLSVTDTLKGEVLWSVEPTGYNVEDATNLALVLRDDGDLTVQQWGLIAWSSNTAPILDPVFCTMAHDGRLRIWGKTDPDQATPEVQWTSSGH